MKIRFLLILIFIFSLGGYYRASAQKQKYPVFGKMIAFGCTVTENMRAFQVSGQSVAVRDTAVDELFKPWVLKDKTISAILLGVKLSPTLTNYELARVTSFSKSYSAYRISDQSPATVIALGITKDNVDDYRYHVVVNDSAEIVHWSKIPRLDKNYGATKPYGFIGSFSYPGKQVLVEVVNIKNYQIRDGVMFDWRQNFKPVLTNLVVASGHRSAETKSSKSAPVNTESSLVNTDPPYSIKRDRITNEITAIEFEQDSVSQIFLALREHPTIVYKVSMINMPDNEYGYWTGASGDDLQPIFTFNNFPQFPGRYEILISPQTSGGVNIPGQTKHIAVTILPHKIFQKKIAVKELVSYIIGTVLVLGLLFWLYRRRANIRLAKSVQAKQNIGLKLSSIRSQLNPHFMFNALTSIQNLMNKNDTESANHYLSRFADLTRKVLNTSTQELISLDDELKILDDYLQMEQLRFNFKYQLIVDPAINKDNIDVPAMLLQPFVENAVKHGVANIREKGTIMVAISQDNNNLIFSISDNGAGFQQANNISDASFGLKLSRERIKLLNEIYTDQPAVLNIVSDTAGTIITITLTNWIS